MTYEIYKAEGQLFAGEYAAIPQDMRESMMRYVEERREPGHFLTAVIQNNLINAVCRADKHNLLLIKEYAQWFYNVAPAPCAGSPEKMRIWLEGKK